MGEIFVDGVIAPTPVILISLFIRKKEQGFGMGCHHAGFPSLIYLTLLPPCFCNTALLSLHLSDPTDYITDLGFNRLFS